MQEMKHYVRNEVLYKKLSIIREMKYYTQETTRNEVAIHEIKYYIRNKALYKKQSTAQETK